MKKETEIKETKIVEQEKVERQLMKREPEDIKAIQIKLNRVIGQVNGIKKMVDDGRMSEDILIQLSAASSVLDSIIFAFIQEIIVNDYVGKVKANNKEISEEIVRLVKKYMQ
ncbi:MAG: metal-sensing transcriptional repressor [Clostridia bacterium]|nr:metal-sensing transcriptional repressor [Clostridia bacterium]